MKRITFLLLLPALAFLSITGCRPCNPDPTPPSEGVSINALVASISGLYDEWEADGLLPSSMRVGDKTFSVPQIVYAEAAVLVALHEGKTGEVVVEDHKPASNPDRDSYDKDEILISGGPADSQGNPEDLVSIARRIIEAARERNQIPNQTLVYRGSDALAFSTDRALVTMARAIRHYSSSMTLPEKVSTAYLPATATLYAFAQQFVGYLEVWENTVADLLSADGSHCEDNGNAWERVHFIPIPMDTPNDWTNKGSQYDPKYQPYRTIEIDGVTYTAAQCWEIAIRGLMDMVTTGGQAFLATMSRNAEIPYGNGSSLRGTPIARPSDANKWGKYPWYESANDGGAVKYNGEPLEEVGIEFLMKCCSWHVVRSFIQNEHNNPLGMIGNFQQFGTSSSTLILEGYEGLISPMREFLIMCRVYKYLLDNDINDNVYDAIKDVKFGFDLYGQEQLPIVIVTNSLSFEASAEPQEAVFSATGSWTATPVESWIHVTPASGDAGSVTVSVSVDDNTAESPRNGSIVIACGEYAKSIAVSQSAYVKPAGGTIKDFAEGFVTCLTVWENTVGTVDADGTHNGATAWTGVHLLPIVNPNAGYTNDGNQYDPMYAPFWSITVGDTEISSNQAWEIAIRGLMELCTAEGQVFLDEMTDRNKPYTLANGKGMNAGIPTCSSRNQWGKYPWYEADNTVACNGEAIETVDVGFLLKCGSWHVVRSFVSNSGNTPLDMIGNYQEFGTGPSTINLDGYVGYISPMRELLIAARIYKYILDNGIETNVYDAIKDVRVDFALY